MAGRATVEVYEDKAGEWRWRLKAANGQIVGGSGEGYRDARDARRAFVDFTDALDAAMEPSTNPAIRSWNMETTSHS